MDYMLKRWTALTRFLDDCRICLSNKAADRALGGVALGRKSWLFAGSDRGGQRAAHPASRIGVLLPWSWQPRSVPRSQAPDLSRHRRRLHHRPRRRTNAVTAC